MSYLTRLCCCLAVLLAGLASASTAARAERRLAFVVGIDRYANLAADAQLQRAVSDADTVADTMGTLGFQVTRLTHETVDQETFFRRFGEFTRTVEPGDLVLFYFSGHGIGLDGSNYLMPADVPALKAGDERLIKARAIAEADIASDLRSRGARVAVLVLDSCRNDPFSDTGHRSMNLSRGFARIEPAEGILTIYAASAGRQALDRLSDTGDPDPNSVFTRIFVRTVKKPGLSLSELGDVVRDDVAALARSAGQEQVPAVSNEVVGARQIFLAGRVTEPAEVPPAVATATPPTVNACPKLFDTARALDTPQAYDAYLAQCRSDSFASMAVAARARLAVATTSAPEAARSVASAVVLTTDEPVLKQAPTPNAYPDGAPSFNCRYARSIVERLICSTGALGAADRRLSDVFVQAAAKVMPDGTASFNAAQSAWRTQRDACGQQSEIEAILNCVAAAYASRSAELGRIVAGGVAVRATPSFNCALGHLPAEQAICADEALALRDRRLAELFAQRFQAAYGAQRKALVAEQGSWWTGRNACGQYAADAIRPCLLHAYDARIRQLSQP